MSDLLYRLDGVVKCYDGRQVLGVETLELYRGEIFGLVGPSGSGKSTLLRLLNFLEPPTSGGIHFAGVCYNGEEPVPVAVRRRVTTVFQRPMLLKRSVRDNVRYGLRLRGRGDTTDMVDEVLEQVGLRALEHHRARSLSGGEAQRVALARAMILEPEVLLLDEPTANLDPYNVQLMESIIRDLNEQRGTTIVLVTHNIFQAKRMAHRVGLLLDGEIVEVAAATDFFESPQDPKTQAFVGGEMIY